MALGPTLTMGFVDGNGTWTPVTETNPLPIEGGGGGATATWDTLEGKPAVIAAGATAAEARTVISAASTADLEAKVDETNLGAVTGFDAGTSLPASAPEGTVFFLYTAP